MLLSNTFGEYAIDVFQPNFSASYISMYIGNKRGYYAEEGMNVEIILMAGLTSTRALIGNRGSVSIFQDGITAIMEFTRHKDRDLMARVYDDHMKTIAGDGTISERLQQIVIDRSKRLMGVTWDVRPDEIFDFSYIRRAQSAVTKTGWTP